MSVLTSTSPTAAPPTGSELRFRPLPSNAAPAQQEAPHGDRLSLGTGNDSSLNWKQALQLGARGDSVRGLQSQLQVQGAPLQADGKFGGLTRSALRNFQAQQQLTQDGIAGPRTQKALGQGLKLKPGQELEHGSKGTKVRGLQSMLNQIRGGGEKNQLRADGRFGNRTERAVLRFQEKHGLEADGIVGPKTLKAMNSAYRRSQKRAAQNEASPTAATQHAVPRPAAQAAARPAAASAQKTEPVTTRPTPAAPTQAAATPAQAAASGQAAVNRPAAMPDARVATPTSPARPAEGGTQAAPEVAAKPTPAVTAQAAPAHPSPAAHVAEKPRPAAVPVAPEKPKEADYGLSARTRASLQASGKWETFQKLPPDLANRYATLSPTMREKMFTQMNGSTWGFSHREAFVNGSAMGQDAFKMMGDKLEEAAAAGKLNPKEVAVLQGDLGKIRRLSPTQRDAIAEAILLQGGR